MYMCDVTLASLEANNGEGFLTLLKRYIPDGDISITGSNFMPYLQPRWTEETVKRLRQDGQGTAVQHWIAYRHKFISKSRGSFLHLTILSAMGVARLPETTFKPTSNFWGWDGRVEEATRKPSSSRFGWNASARAVGSRKETETAFWSATDATRKCRDKFTTARDPAKRFCHKMICGKELTSTIVQSPALYTEESLADAVFLLRRIGPARGGYVRSHALVHQMQYLGVVPSCDYALFSHSDLVRRPQSVRARSETVVQALKHRPFIDRFVEEYGSVAVFRSKVMQAWTDGRRGSIDTTMTPQ
ncbi:hypothetical protein DFH08DRAFT_810263 [Mycena albidolilacea]|uniref:Uncharacterized protein n=1 Tax=Mycena albidolilacea TaxID=1033008 RepID=A0AAD6ZZ81_9AGAR|nr:hypothetical protein DFH08DRAFT_810263 [Mycena albidolilacea]